MWHLGRTVYCSLSTWAEAVLNKIFFLGFGGPGLKISVLKEHSYPAPVLELEGEGRAGIYNIFGRTGILRF